MFVVVQREDCLGCAVPVVTVEGCPFMIEQHLHNERSTIQATQNFADVVQHDLNDVVKEGRAGRWTRQLRVVSAGADPPPESDPISGIVHLINEDRCFFGSTVVTE
jgi:hypothetical protein